MSEKNEVENPFEDEDELRRMILEAEDAEIWIEEDNDQVKPKEKDGQ